MNIQIRNISLEDAVHINRLSEQLGYSLPVETTLANIKDVLILKDHIGFVAVDNKEVVAWAHAYKTITIESLSFIELAGLVVDEEYRNKGIGKILVDRVKQWCIEKNTPSLRVRSNVKRKEAHRFYLANGFIEIKEQKAFHINL